MAREVRISLVIDEHGAVRAMRSTVDQSSKTEHGLSGLDKKVKELGKSFGGLKSMVGLGLGSLGIGGLAFGLKDIASKTGEIATETEKFHSISGIGANTSLRYTAALKARGIGADAGGKAFRFLAKNVQLAERQEHTFSIAQEKASKKGKIATGLLGLQATAFQKLGVNLGSFSKLSESAKFELITKKFEAMKPGMEKTRLALQLFGRGGTALLPVLEKGTLGLSKQMEMAKKFFPTLKDGAGNLNELLEKQAESKMAWEGLEFTIGVKLVPAMTAAMGLFSKLAVSIEHGKGIWGSLEKTIGIAIQLFEGVYNWFRKDKVATDALGVSLGVLAGLWATSKVLDFLSAIRGLTVLSLLAGDASAAAGGFALMDASLAPILGPIAVLAAALWAIEHFSAPKVLGGEGKGQSGRSKPGTKGRSYLEMASSLNPAGAKGTISEAGLTPKEERANILHWERAALHVGVASPKQLSALHANERKFAAQERAEHPKPEPAIHVHLNLDSAPVAEAIIHNPRSSRVIAESTAKHVAYMQARG
jgi:hypothetical protein